MVNIFSSFHKLILWYYWVSQFLRLFPSLGLSNTTPNEMKFGFNKISRVWLYHNRSCQVTAKKTNHPPHTFIQSRFYTLVLSNTLEIINYYTCTRPNKNYLTLSPLYSHKYVTFFFAKILERIVLQQILPTPSLLSMVP